jgi:hypothetical protein
VLCL